MSLNEFNRIKQNSYFSPKSITKFPSANHIDTFSSQNNKSNFNILSGEISENSNLEKALNHKKKLLTMKNQSTGITTHYLWKK